MSFLSNCRRVLTMNIPVGGRVIRVAGWVIVVAAIIGCGVVGHVEMKLVEHLIAETGVAGDPETLPAPVAQKLASFAADTGDPAFRERRGRLRAAAPRAQLALRPQQAITPRGRTHRRRATP